MNLRLRCVMLHYRGENCTSVEFSMEVGAKTFSIKNYFETGKNIQQSYQFEAEDLC